MKKKVLVTGGLGFIGSHAVVELINLDYDVIIIDDMSNSRLFILDNIQKITGIRPQLYNKNIASSIDMSLIFEEEKNITAVIHLAAFKSISESVDLPLKYFKNNVYSVINLLELMKLFGINTFIYTSSCTVYGDPNILPLKEDSLFHKALSAYGSSNQISEEIIAKTTYSSSLNSIVLRLFNPIGAHNSALLGELSIGKPSNIMPSITLNCAGILNDLTVFGNDYSTFDGSCIRDYIHVTDVATAIVKSLDRLLHAENSNKYELFNIGTGKGISVLQLIHAFEKHNKVNIKYSFGERRSGDAAVLYADANLAKELLDWIPQKSLKDMVVDAWNWQKHIYLTNNHAALDLLHTR